MDVKYRLKTENGTRDIPIWSFGISLVCFLYLKLTGYIYFSICFHTVYCKIIAKNTSAIYGNVVIPFDDSTLVSLFGYSGCMSGNGIGIIKISFVKIGVRKEKLWNRKIIVFQKNFKKLALIY